MRTVLVLGGYGGFGARVSQLLAERGFAVIVAGRSLVRAEAFCARHPGLPLRAAELDRDAPLRPHLVALDPWLVIDAAGPFQGNDYHVPKACIAAGCHYSDLADARAFVAGIGALDPAARTAGVSVVSGASSVPALSAAVADRLAEGLSRVHSIDMALSASNRASGSKSVTQAILSYVGKPIRMWRGRRWGIGHGWQEMGEVHYAVPGRKPLPRRVALCEVPDLDLFPSRYAGQPAVRFRAGTEIEAQNLALWLVSWPVRWGWLNSALPLVPVGLLVQRLLRGVGGDRSAMRVELRGDSAVRRWTLLAEDGDGPWVPALAATLLASKLAQGALPPGAMPAAGLLALGDFNPLFAGLRLFTAIGEERRTPLYARIMGDDFEALPDPLRQMHDPASELLAHGRARIEVGRNPLARLIRVLFHLPPAIADATLSVTIACDRDGERWTRDFGGHRFSSRMSEEGGLLAERFGPVTFLMRLQAEADGLTMHHAGWRFLGVPMPRWLGPRGIARERCIGGRFHFDVPIALPLIGLLVHYSGWLTIEDARRAADEGAGSPAPPHPITKPSAAARGSSRISSPA